MRRIVVVLLICSLSFAFALAGCSDDDNGENGSPVIDAGELETPDADDNDEQNPGQIDPCEASPEPTEHLGEPCAEDEDCTDGLCRTLSGMGHPQFEGFCHQKCFPHDCPEACDGSGICSMLVDTTEGNARIDDETGLALGICTEAPGGDREAYASCGMGHGTCEEGLDCIEFGDEAGTCLPRCNDDDDDCPDPVGTDEPVQCAMGRANSNEFEWCIQRCLSDDDCINESTCAQNGYCGHLD